MAITLGLVEAVDDNGVYVSMPGSRGVLRGPYLTLQDVAVGDRVLTVTTDDGETVIVGLASAAAPRSTPATSTDNTVPRFDGTGGALQNSGVTIADDTTLTGPKEIVVQAEGNPSDGGGGSIRTAGSRYTLVLKPRNADATYATASEFYYDTTYVGWWAESKMGCTGDFTCNAYGYFAGNLRAMKTSGDTQIEVRTVTGNPYLTRTSDTTADIYDIWKIGGAFRFYIRVTTSQFLIQRYDSSAITALGIERTTGKVTVGAAGAAAGIELGSSGPTITTGTGAPSHSAPDGSLYLRTDGGAGSTLYVREAGAWVAK